MSGSEVVSKEFLEKMKDYVGETKNTVIGIPDFKCPKCGNYQISENEVNPINRSIIGIDVLLNFFITLGQRVQYARG
jgi:hypothetical protein